MSIIIRLQNLPWAASSVDIRTFFAGLSIPVGGVHIVGGEMGEAFIVFSTDEDARLAMERNGGSIKDMKIKLLLSSRTEMARVIEQARSQNTQVLPSHLPMSMKAVAANDSDRRTSQERGLVPSDSSRSVRERKMVPTGKDIGRSRSRSPLRDRERGVQYDHAAKLDMRPPEDFRAVRDDNYRSARSSREDDVLQDRKYGNSRVPPKGMGTDPNISMHSRVSSTAAVSFGAKQVDVGSVPRDYGRAQHARVSEAPYLFPAAMHSASHRTDTKMMNDQSHPAASFPTSTRYPRPFDSVISEERDRAMSARPGNVAEATPPYSKDHMMPDQYARESTGYARGYADVDAAPILRDPESDRMAMSRMHRGRTDSSPYVQQSERDRNTIPESYEASSAQCPVPEPSDNKMRFYGNRMSAENSSGALSSSSPTQPQLNRNLFDSRKMGGRQSRFQPEQDSTYGPSSENDRYRCVEGGMYGSSSAYIENPDFDERSAHTSDYGMQNASHGVRDRYDMDDSRGPPGLAWAENRYRDYPNRAGVNSEMAGTYDPAAMDAEAERARVSQPMPRHSFPLHREQERGARGNMPGSPIRPRDPFPHKHEDQIDVPFDRFQNKGRREPLINEQRIDSQVARTGEPPNVSSARKRVRDSRFEELDRSQGKSTRWSSGEDPRLESAVSASQTPVKRDRGSRSAGTHERPQVRGGREPLINEQRAGPTSFDNPEMRNYPSQRWESENRVPVESSRKPTVGDPRSEKSDLKSRESRFSKREDEVGVLNKPSDRNRREEPLPDNKSREGTSSKRLESLHSRSPPRRAADAALDRSDVKAGKDPAVGVPVTRTKSQEIPEVRRTSNFAVKVRGLPSDACEADILELFRDIYIPPENIKFDKNAQGKPTGLAFVKFLNSRDFEEGLRRSGFDIGNCFPEVTACSPAAFEAVSSKSEPLIEKSDEKSISSTASREKMPSKCETTADPHSAAKQMPLPANQGDSQKVESVKPPPPRVVSANHRNPEQSDGELCVELGGLPYSCEKGDILEFFDGLNVVDTRIERLPDGRSSGEGYVEFASVADCQAAVKRSGKMIGHRYITVCATSKKNMNALPKERNSSASGKKPLLGAPPKKTLLEAPTEECPSDGEPAYCVIIGGVPKTATNYDLEAFFAEANVVPMSLHVMKDTDDLPSGRAFAEFHDNKQRLAGLQRNMKILHDSKISVRAISYQEMCRMLGGAPKKPAKPYEANAPQPPRRVLIPTPGPDGLLPESAPPRPLPPRLRGVPPPVEGHPHPIFEGPRGGPRQRLRGPPPLRGAVPRPPFSSRDPVPFRQKFPGPPPAAGEDVPNNFGRPGCVVSVTNLHFRAGLEDLLYLFSEYTLDNDSIIRKYTNSGQPTGDARIAFRTPEEALSAIEKYNQRPVLGRPVYLSLV